MDDWLILEKIEDVAVGPVYNITKRMRDFRWCYYGNVESMAWML